MKYTFGALFYVLLTGCNSAGKKDAHAADAGSPTLAAQKINAKDIPGTWVRSCDGGSGHVSIPEDAVGGEVVIEVNSNQIVIGAKMDTTEFAKTKTMSFRLTEPVDLGRGGASLDWKHFSKDSVIAKLRITGKKKGQLEWIGFYNKKTKAYFWTHNMGMLIDSLGNEATTNIVAVVNCD